MKFNVVWLFSFIVAILGCQQQKCENDQIELIFYDHTIEETGKVYVHYLLLEDYKRDCMDSASIVDIALSYVDTCSVGQPISTLKVFNSRDNFIPNSTSQPLHEISGDCLVNISFNDTMGISNFSFYDQNGRAIFTGRQWRIPATVSASQ